MNEAHKRLIDHATTHHGVFTRRDAIELGMGESSIYSGVISGRYLRIAPGVFVMAGTPETLWQQMAVAALSMPALSAISHRTAAELWGLTDRGIRHLDVVTTRWDRIPRPNVIVHESLDLREEDIQTRSGLPVTSAVRTVVDLGAVSPWQVERAMEAGIRQDLFEMSDVEAFVARVGRKGRRGVGVIRPLLDARRRWDRATESALEDLFRKVVDESYVPMPEPQYVIRDEFGDFVCRADFAYPEPRVMIELDSEAHHMDRITFRRDRSKQNRAVTIGWTVLRYTWWDLHEDPTRAISDIATALGLSK